MEDEDDQYLEQHYTIDHVYKYEINPVFITIETYFEPNRRV